ncbi:hypothetical protein STAFG_2933 [Streptomyces afghaniensis 772]|uniref:Uncharacterized protein n=1 Tax=Streptomyces afghaniensis 772 TaxID=1283301 RepID=S4NNN2_9ACTN|nr:MULTISPECIES: hypothetical protein [Streptomyces]EPJ39989.1 hypothetical protein STAFG_2933 [Streptomyces afghaniensis 772]UOB12938.1 hypothetical protein MQE23_29490 [Streptomyces sp. HP-A2021]
MSSERPVNPRFAEDMHLNFVSGPPRYRNHTDKPVRYITVADKENGAVLGYLWAGDEDDAAGWEPRQAGGPHAVNEGGFRIRRLRSAKERGLLPSQALAELLADPEPAGKGRGLADSLTDAPNAAAVEALAQSE